MTRPKLHHVCVTCAREKLKLTTTGMEVSRKPCAMCNGFDMTVRVQVPDSMLLKKVENPVYPTPVDAAFIAWLKDHEYPEHDAEPDPDLPEPRPEGRVPRKLSDVVDDYRRFVLAAFRAGWQAAPNGEATKCYCGRPIDTSNPDCVTFKLCTEHHYEA